MGCICFKANRRLIMNVAINPEEEEKKLPNSEHFHSLGKFSSPATSFYVTMKDHLFKSNNTEVFFSNKPYAVKELLSQQIDEFPWEDPSEEVPLLRRVTKDLLGTAGVPPTLKSCSALSNGL